MVSEDVPDVDEPLAQWNSLWRRDAQTEYTGGFRQVVVVRVGCDERVDVRGRGSVVLRGLQGQVVVDGLSVRLVLGGEVLVKVGPQKVGERGEPLTPLPGSLRAVGGTVGRMASRGSG